MNSRRQYNGVCCYDVFLVFKCNLRCTLGGSIVPASEGVVVYLSTAPVISRSLL